MSFIPKMEDLFEEQAALIEQQQKQSTYSIVEIGGPDAYKEWKRHQAIIVASQRIISDAKAAQHRDIAIRMVEEHISELKLDPIEKAYTQTKKTTKFDVLVEALRAARKRHFADDENKKD